MTTEETQARKEVGTYWQKCADEAKANKYKKEIILLRKYYQEALILEKALEGIAQEAGGLDDQYWLATRDAKQAAARARASMEWQFNFAKRRIAELCPALAETIPETI